MAVWSALGAAAFFVIQSEKQIAARASSFRTFDQHAREAAMSLGDVRAAQQAYVAAGQDNTFWMPKVAYTNEQTIRTIAGLRATATDAAARAALEQAANTIAMFGDIDKRAREYVKSEATLMAADVIFTEGGEAASTAARSVEGARLAERQALDAADAATRKREAMVLGGAGGFAALIVLLLMPRVRMATDATDSKPANPDDLEEWAGPARPASAIRATAAPSIESPPAAAAKATSQSSSVASTPPAEPPVANAAPAQPPVPASTTIPAAQTMIKAAADLATDFGRVRNLDDLQRVLGRSAEAMEASGLLVWMGSASGDDLRPLLAHGYTDQTLSRIPPVARTDTNAAAAAYRSGQLQIVVSKPGASGALVAPILAANGCIGALSAEFRGAETSESVQALATIVAGHLATVLGTAPAENIEHPAAAQA